jgi:hypothetical protein
MIFLSNVQIHVPLPFLQGSGFYERLCLFLRHGWILIFDVEEFTHRGEEISIVHMSAQTEIF